MTNAQKKVYAIVLASIFISLSIAGYIYATKPKQRTDMFYVKGDDPRIESARLEALKNIDIFITFLTNKPDTNHFYEVKKDFIENGVHEHMWVNVDTYENGIFYGTLGNTPELLKDMKRNQPIQVKKDDIEDFVIYDDNGDISLGAFSTKAVLGKDKLNINDL